MLPTVDRTELPKEPVINDENSTAMICNPLAAIRDDGSTYDLSDNTWIGLKISPTLQSISYIYFNGVNGRGAPNQGEWQNDKFARFSTRQIEIWKFNLDNVDNFRIPLRKRRAGPVLWYIDRNEKIQTEFSGCSSDKKKKFC